MVENVKQEANKRLPRKTMMVSKPPELEPIDESSEVQSIEVRYENK
jgi:hypothetical protein